MTDAFLKVEGVQHNWPASQTQIVFPDWSLKRGEFSGVFGPSGCGKSTLLRLISGELPVQTGTITAGDAAVHTLNDKDRRVFRLHHIGFVFQDHPLLPYLTALENIVLPLRLTQHGFLRPADLERGQALLERLDLGAKASNLPQQLSQGERQRVAIARSLIHRPSLILADEPTAGLDHLRTEDVMTLLRAMATEQDATLVMVTHDRTLRGHFDSLLDLAEAGK